MTRHKDLTRPSNPIPEIDIPSIGLGTMRTGASIMAILLQAECEFDRASIIADLIRRFGLTPEDISERYYSRTCRRCGMASYLHTEGFCPDSSGELEVSE